tara:strand:+ start:35636 stop:35833 length:198 start_codon:yes stop_codon:yes gene_type:complete
MMTSDFKIKQDKIKQLQKDKIVALDKIDTLRKMKKDFPKSDDVRFSLQDAMTDLNKIDKQLMMLD